MAVALERTSVSAREMSLEIPSPTWRVRRQPAIRISNRCEIEPEIETAATDETKLTIELVQVPHDARRDQAFIAVHLVFELAERQTGAVEHEMSSNDAARVRETVGKEIRFRVEQQTRRFGAVGADDDGFRALKDLGFLGVEILHAY